MVIIGLLLIALICVALGLITASSVWLVASLIATVGAGFLLYKLRDVIGVSKGAPPTPASPPSEPAEDLTPAAVLPRAPTTDDHADQSAEAKHAFDATRPDEIPLEAGDDDSDQVWVIDGRPRFHLGDCAIIKGQDAEPIPYEQATEDGFMPCSLCEPEAVRPRAQRGAD